MSEAAVTSDDGKIACKIDGARVHSIQQYIKDRYSPEWTIERYKKEFPSEPLLSPRAQQQILESRKRQKEASEREGLSLYPMAEVFGLPPAKCMNARGQPIMVQVVDRSALDAESITWIPDVDPNYVFDIELVKVALIALQMNLPGLFWGYHGSGKTTCWEQVCSRTGRPFMRLQHTINTEEANILGQWIVRDGATHFIYGPLAIAMVNGWVYCADEYDFALPSVTSVYQPVLEGKNLMIKEAPPELRVVRPHKNFRFVATGNTNGVGDETGLYQGTQIQNAANYSRFGVTEEVKYPPLDIETAIVVGQSGARKQDAKKLVEFANEWRKAFAGGQVSSTISPRELIRAAMLALVRGGDWRGGLCLAFANRLSRTDKEVANQYAQRIFGGER